MKGRNIMTRQKEKSANILRYYPDDVLSICALCGNDMGAVYFKEKLICEECLDIIKKIY
jgi:predicted PolB exonuclease-like 3'-5' exonuclease